MRQARSDGCGRPATTRDVAGAGTFTFTDLSRAEVVDFDPALDERVVLSDVGN